MLEINDNNIDNHIDKLVDLIDHLSETQFSVLVGPNGTGKSLVRKQIGVRLYKKYKYNALRHISMELRTGTFSELGALSGIFRDNDVEPTSICTLDLIRKMKDNMGTTDDSNHKKLFLVIDEPEIGMSRESQISIGQKLVEYKDFIAQNHLGMMVITHSDIILAQLVAARFDFNYIGYDESHKSYCDYVDRLVEPTDFDWLDKWSSALFIRIRDRSKSVK